MVFFFFFIFIIYTAPKHTGFRLWGASDGTLRNLQELQDRHR